MTISQSTHPLLVVAGLTAVAEPIPLEAQGAPSPVAEGYVVTADSVRLFFRVAGRGPDTLVAIHGGPGVDLESIYGGFLPLADRHTVIFYDQRGAGRSTLPSDTLKLAAERQVADLDAVRRHFGLGKVTLVALADPDPAEDTRRPAATSGRSHSSHGSPTRRRPRA